MERQDSTTPSLPCARVARDSLSYSTAVTFLNPFGYLPSTLYGFFGYLTVAYIGLSVIFGLKSCISRKHLLGLHFGIAVVILTGLFECMVWYFVYRNGNQTGTPSCCPIPDDTRIAVVLSVFKKSVSRVLLLVVSLGYGITRPRLGWSLSSLVALLGIVFTGSSLIFELERMKHIEEDPTSTITSFWSLPVNVCDLIFLCWTYLELVKREKELKEARQTAKLEMYQKLIRTLVAFVVLWFMYAIGIVAVNQEYAQVESSWHFLDW